MLRRRDPETSEQESLLSRLMAQPALLLELLGTHLTAEVSERLRAQVPGLRTTAVAVDDVIQLPEIYCERDVLMLYGVAEISSGLAGPVKEWVDVELTWSQLLTGSLVHTLLAEHEADVEEALGRG
jgi:hypothetical protein